MYRSRLVAKDFKPKSKVNDQEGLFAATPPLELVKMLILKAARGSSNRHAGVRKVMFLDVSKAHLYAPMLDEEFVQLPPERWTEGTCARLIYTHYGIRTAASNWEKEYSILEDDRQPTAPSMGKLGGMEPRDLDPMVLEPPTNTKGFEVEITGDRKAVVE